MKMRRLNLFFIGLLLVMGNLAFSQTIYVNSSAYGGGNNGTSWFNAYQSLQDALSSATGGAEIWVAQGTYKPGTDRDESFVLLSGVKLYGGFEGGETSPEQRNIKQHPTVLSGDIGAQGDMADNSYHVVSGSNIANTALIDGFIIERGRTGTSGTQMYGGGIYLSSSSPKINNCTIRNNTAVHHGGGIYCINSSPEITNTAFYGNTVINYDGGGLFSESGSPNVINCLFHDNAAGRMGGGLEVYSSGNPRITNSTFTQNSAGFSGGGIRIYYNNGTRITNSIVWGNGPNNISIAGDLVVNNSITDSLSYTGSNNIYEAPMFVDAANNDFHVDITSYAINAGTNTPQGISLPAIDLDGNQRVQQGTVDIGCYEGSTQLPNDVILVNSCATGINNGASWPNAYQSLQDALSSATGGKEIWVAQGTYKPGTDRDESFVLLSGVKLYGGFEGGETSPEQRNIKQHPTVLSGDIGAQGDMADNSYHVVSGSNIANTALIDGFIIERGRTGTSGTQMYGGGIYLSSSSPKINNCTIRNNTAVHHGGGIYCINSSPEITNTAFYGNTVINYDGGGLFSEAGSPNVINCLFHDNAAGRMGGGLEVYSSGNPRITNSTFTQNSAGFSGGGIRIYYNNGTRITNSIVWGNGPNNISIAGDLVVNNSITDSLSYTGSNNIYEAPMFVDAANNDFHVDITSYAINAGTNTPQGISLPAIDLDGNQRVQQGTVDIGCYEGSTQLPNDVILVNSCATGINNGASWPNAYQSLQDALSSATGGKEIWVAQGTYKPGTDRDESFVLLSGVKLYGGFEGGETSPEQRNIKQHPTVLSGDIGAQGDMADNSYHVVSGSNIANTALIDGFIIERGRTGTSGTQMYGGGIYLSSSSPKINNCTIRNNTAVHHGGGIYCINSSPEITNTAFYGNTVINYDGGGLFSEAGSPNVINCLFHDNAAGRMGGGLEVYSSGNPRITNSTFTQNSAGSTGGGIRIYYNNGTRITNSIVWGNGPNNISIAGDLVVNNSITDSLSYTGSNNIYEAPMFVDAANNDFHVDITSYAINAGTNTPQGISLPAIDLDGNQRVQQGTVDIGCYEIIGIVTPEALTQQQVDVSVLAEKSAKANQQQFGLPSTSNNLLVFPNPVDNILNIKFTRENEKHLKVRIYNMNGQTRYEYDYNTMRGINEISIDVSNLRQGMWIVQIEDKIEKFIKQ